MITRRQLLGGAAAAAAAGLTWKAHKMIHGTPPWHLWGSEQSVTVVATGSTTTQLARVHYKRPDSWTFFFVATLLTTPDPIPIGPRVLQIFFDVTLGVGRQSTTIQSFRKFELDFISGGPAPHNIQFFANSAPNVIKYDDNTTTFSSDANITEIPASDIQCQARIVTNVSPLTLSVGAYFSPRTHIRPEWYANEFTAGELDGR